MLRIVSGSSGSSRVEWPPRRTFESLYSITTARNGAVGDLCQFVMHLRL